ncbi:hypothetical protein GCM10027613_08880 [Microlunatus endophyticus]
MTHVVIIGGGPGGYEAALVGAQLGGRVTLIDSEGIGGASVLTDCVPSKTLIATAEVMTEVKESAELGIRFGPDKISADLGAVNKRVLALACQQSADIADRLRTAGVDLVVGSGRMDGPERVIAETADGFRSFDADVVLISTGAHPRVLPDAVPDGERILSWTQLYELPELPQRLIVIGSGVTGAEFASAYHALGAEVVLVSSRDRVLPGEDPDAARVLEEVLTRRGMQVMAKSRAAAVTRDQDQVVVTLTDGRTVTGSHCLLAVGSIPNTEGLGLEKAGVQTDDRGFITVDKVSRTTARGVYAAGDCTGVLMLASVAAMQGRIAMWHSSATPSPRWIWRRCRPTSSPHRRSPPSASASIGSIRGVQCRPGAAAAGGQRPGQDAGSARRLRQDLLPADHRHHRRRCRGRTAGQRVDLPAGRRRRPADHR